MRSVFIVNPCVMSCEFSVSYALHETLQSKKINLHQGVRDAFFLDTRLEKRDGRYKTWTHMNHKRCNIL